MKLIIEKHPELTKLINFFAEVEDAARRLGLNVDDLNPERKENTNHLHTYFRQNAESISRYRKDLLQGERLIPEVKASKCCSVSSLSIHKRD